MNEKQQRILGVLALVVIAGLVVWLISKPKTNKQVRKDYVSRQFVGNVDKFNDVNLTVKGYFVVDGHPELSTSDAEVTATVSWNEKTEFIKREFVIPKNTTTGFLHDVPNTYTASSLFQFGQDLQKASYSVTIDADPNIYGDEEFSATKITYERYTKK